MSDTPPPHYKPINKCIKSSPYIGHQQSPIFPIYKAGYHPELYFSFIPHNQLILQIDFIHYP
jgi:hypothetical protein